MEYRKLGRSGVLVSPLCLGTMNFGGSTDEAGSFAIMQKAVEGGINFFDSANVYNQGESERITGKFLKERNLREQVVLATKVYSRVGELPNQAGATRYHILKACEDSLRRLQTDHIDLYQLHRPPLTHSQEETLRAFDDLIHAGKVLYIGASTHPAWMVMEALALSERYGLNRYISEQPPYNLLDRRIENELIPLAQKYDLAILPWSPLAMGVLAGRYAQTDQYPKAHALSAGTRTWSKHGSPNADSRWGRLSIKWRKNGAWRACKLSLLWNRNQPGIPAPIIGPPPWLIWKMPREYPKNNGTTPTPAF